MYVVGQNPTIMAIYAYIKAQRALMNEPSLFNHDEGYFVTQMKYRKDRDPVLYSGLYLFYDKPMIVKQFTPTFDFDKEGP